ncbi:hypothetical protein Dimus_029298 [Dionaea muscipula]
MFLRGSCDGLLCITVDQDLMLLWNPATKKYRLLPPPMLSSDEIGVALCGFGFDSLNDDYKIVRAVCYDDFSLNNDDDDIGVGMEKELKVEVFTLKSGSWRLVASFPYCSHFNQMGKLVNGTVHWKATQSCSLYPVNGKYGLPLRILGFSLKEEKLFELPHPDFDGDSLLFDLGVLRECLCISCDYKGRFEMWILKEYNVSASWTKLLSMQLSEPVRTIEPVCFVDDDEIMVDYLGRRLAIFNIRDNSSRNLILPGAELFDSFYAATCVESLVSPWSTNGRA